MLFQLMAFSQRANRRSSGSQTSQFSQTSPPVKQPANFEGPYFNVILTNNDTISYWLKVGLGNGSEDGDTLNLSRTFPCNYPDAGFYYDFHDQVEQEDDCVKWYTLRPIKPNDSLRFVVKLKDFISGYMSRLYYCYVRGRDLSEMELCLLTQPKSLVIMKVSRDVESRYVVLDKDIISTNISKQGLTIQILPTNQ